MRFLSFLLLACVLLSVSAYAEEEKSWWGDKKSEASAEIEAVAEVKTETKAKTKAEPSAPAAAAEPVTKFRGVECGQDCSQLQSGYMMAASRDFSKKSECDTMPKPLQAGCSLWVKDPDGEIKKRFSAANMKMQPPPIPKGHPPGAIEAKKAAEKAAVAAQD